MICPAGIGGFFKGEKMATSRALLHFNKLGQFTEYLESQGYVKQPNKEYEALRMTHKQNKTLIVWKKDSATCHYTVHGESLKQFYKWKKSTKVKA